MKKILFSLIAGLIFIGITVSKGTAQTSPKIDASLVLDQGGYLLNDPETNEPEPIKIAITVKNIGTGDIITSDGFSSKDFHLCLAFIDPDGELIKANEIVEERLRSDTVQVIQVNGEQVQVEPVEILAGPGGPDGAFISSTTLPNKDTCIICSGVLAYYTLPKPGKYSVKAIIPIRTYADIFQTINGVDLAKLDTAIFEGVLESNTVNFSLVVDEDGDGHSQPIAMFPPSGDPAIDPVFLLADCDDRPNGADGIAGTPDDGENISPSEIEIPRDNIDNDCNPATLDKGKDCCGHGKPRVLTMMYRKLDCGSSSHLMSSDFVTCSDFGALPNTVYIIANDRNVYDQKQAKIWFAGPVNLDDTFDINAANAGETRLKGNTFVHIFDNDPAAGGVLLQKVSFHTSCSVPLFTGDQFGSVTLMDCVGENE